MKILAVILSILALCWCFRLEMSSKTLKKRQESIPAEKFIYNIEPKKIKPAFGRISKGE